MIRRLLVANRAEIASRVFRTCRDLGIGTVAVHSDADRELPYVREADASVRLPGYAPADTYLRIDRLIDAARRSGADAVHPGYGFLSENATFARAVVDAGLTWVGPTPESIEAMGSKLRAKELVRQAGVPVLETPDPVTADDLPVLVKASAGGGGRGMRVVRDIARLEDEIAAARAEAEAAFGDGTVFLEPYVERGRHVEVQVVGDQLGTIEVFGERDCSLQRRHQKVVEETPAPRLPTATREALHIAARHAAAAVGYVGAGTVEFLYDAGADRFFFLEMNTRLQVEHPITEEAHGVDLVALQIAVAEGRPVFPARAPSGHAIEARLYAEDPAGGYHPQSGTLTAFDIPDAPGLRVDAGFVAGNEVSTFYDAMLAKLVVHAATREQAARTLAGVLRRTRIHGLVTNRVQLADLLDTEEFLSGEISTAFLDEHPPVTSQPTGQHPVAAALALAERARVARTVQQGVPVAWRNVVSRPQVTHFRSWSSASQATRGSSQADDPITVEWYGGRDGYAVDGLTVVSAGPEQVTLECDGVATTYDVAMHGERVDVDSPTGHVTLSVFPRFTDPADVVASGSLLAPMPGTVVSVAVAKGDEVAAGATVLVLEAMKMQHTVSAPHAGTVTVLSAQPGDQVAAGEVLAVVAADEPDSPTHEGTEES
ncbi:MAG: ATP-grasp domain-containing protein [Nocardioides sp.]|nr:ATP-grasp domain-containing protein [Nocardioides sp.]